MRIGEFVRSYGDAIFRYCQDHPDELSRLMDGAYSNRVFKLSEKWPFCLEENKIPPRERSRYWSQYPFFVDGKRMLICSQWTDRNRHSFYDYLTSKGILDQEPLGDVGEPSSISPRRSNKKTVDKRRHGSRAIGDAQNAVIRFILSNLGEEEFDEDDWKQTKADFNGSCAYCVEGLIEHMDHVIPINKTDLGEHRLGNLVPSCKDCNGRKHFANFRQFLENRIDRAECIEKHMASKAYVPLGDNKKVKAIIAEAHNEVKALAHRYIAIIEAVLTSDLSSAKDA